MLVFVIAEALLVVAETAAASIHDEDATLAIRVQ
jgi:hypothetical protein